MSDELYTPESRSMLSEIERLRKERDNDEELWNILAEHAKDAGYRNHGNQFVAATNAIFGLKGDRDKLVFALQDIVRLLKLGTDHNNACGAYSIAKRALKDVGEKEQ